MKKTQFCLIVFILLTIASASLAQEGMWTNRTDMPTARNRAIHIFGGGGAC